MANYTDMSAVEDSTGKRLSSVAEEFRSVWGRYDLNNNLHFGLGVRYTDTVTGANGTTEIDWKHAGQNARCFIF